ncbi:MAG TPA: DNA polymerase III subunit delta' [Chloroflexota bacterium]|nr:DNA polymerase III subunit delta' [Chloroflexota bacterium]
MASPFQTFIGNAPAVRGLQLSLAGGRVAHAYLLTGPAKVGKRTLARALAAALVCAAREAPAAGADGSGPPAPAAAAPCGACRACQLVARGSHPDVRLFEAEAGRRAVTIEQIRQLEHAAGLRPYEGGYKVFIVSGVDAMAEAAANALLKTLEEPPDDTVIVLTASDVSQVLPTIVSRCREVALRPVAAEVIAAGLVERGLAPDRATELARLAAGRPGWAIAAGEDPSYLEARLQRVELLESLLARPRVRRLSAAGDFGDAASTKDVLDVWLGWWRDALLLQQDLPELVANADRVDALRRLGACHPPHTAWQTLRRIQETRQYVDLNVNVRLAVEALLLDLPECLPSST